MPSPLFLDKNGQKTSHRGALRALGALAIVTIASACRPNAGAVSLGGSSSSRRPETSQAAAPPTAPSDAVGEKFEAWMTALSGGDNTQVEKLWHGAKDAERRIAKDLDLAKRTGGIELVRVSDSTATEMVALVRAKGAESWLCLTFEVDGDAPHAIEKIQLRPANPPAKTDDAPLDFDDRARAQVMQQLIRELNRAYVYPEKAALVERELTTRQRNHAYDDLPSRIAFAAALTHDLRRVTRDKHLHVDLGCSQGTARPPREPNAARAVTPSSGEKPHMFAKTERLEGNVAYIDIATFAIPVDVVRDEVREAMTAAADANAIIFDVRRSEGGEPETVSFVSSYLFGAEPVHLNSLYWRISNRTDDFFTDPKVPGTKFGPTKPVYVLTSAQTFSAAEEFPYNLQARKRAVIVGETTGGGAHPGDVTPLPHGFTVFLPNGRAINPVTQTNWEGTGVKPDVAAPADEALKTAHDLARK